MVLQFLIGQIKCQNDSIFLRQVFCTFDPKFTYMRVLLILITIFLLSRIFFRFILPLIARYFFAKAAKNMQGQFYQQQQRATNRREGEVRIETPNNPQNQSNRDFEDGEFVDYTEVK
jgi:ABC-type multidrug transport system fused ATPase/permease subunit